jgi:AcrR family transcriptional regulator
MRDSVRPRDTRDAILDATDRLLSRNGYKKMTIDDLAAEVGIGKGSVYLHFKSKEEIVLSHIDRIIERMKTRLVEIAGRNISTEKKLRSMLVERVIFRFDSVQHYTQSLNDLLAHIRPKLLERRRRYFEEEARIFAAIIEEGSRTGTFLKVDPLDAARTMLTATNSLLPFSLSTKELGERREIEKRTIKIADLLLKGLSKKE